MGSEHPLGSGESNMAACWRSTVAQIKRSQAPGHALSLPSRWNIRRYARRKGMVGDARIRGAWEAEA